MKNVCRRHSTGLPLTGDGGRGILDRVMAGDAPLQPDAKLLRLLELVKQLAAPVELDDMLAQVIDVGREVFEADRGSVFLYDGGPRELFMKVATGLKELRFSIDQGIAGQCARERAIINVPDCYADKRFNQEIDRKTGYRTNCLIAVPLIGLDDELVGVMQLLNPARGYFDDADEQLAAALGSQAAVALQRAMLIEERLVKLRMENDLAIAREIQQNVLPKELPEIEGYDIAAFNRPADETGGDIYDVARRPEDEDKPAAPVMLMLADATGHGIGPALSVTQSRAMFRMALRLGGELKQIVANIDEQLEADLDSSRFITAFFGELDPEAHVINYEAPGQGPLLHYRAASKDCDLRAATSVPLGIMPGLPGDEHEPFAMGVGDFFVLLTDGFFEAANADDEEFGEARVQAIIAEHADGGAKTLIDALVAALDAWRGDGHQADDWTAVVAKRLK